MIALASILLIVALSVTIGVDETLLVLTFVVVVPSLAYWGIKLISDD